MEFQNISQYLESYSKILCGQKNQMRNLIGNTNWLEDGIHKEKILIDVIEKFVPNTFKISSGIILDENGKSSGQIDILIYKAKSPILYQRDGLVVIPVKYVRGVIEVKTSLRAKSYSSACKKIKEAQQLIGLKNNKNKVFYGIFVFEKVNENRWSFGEKYSKEDKLKFVEKWEIDESIDKIMSFKTCVNGVSYSTLSVKREQNKVKLKQSLHGESSFSFFIISLLKKLDCEGIELLENELDKKYLNPVFNIL